MSTSLHQAVRTPRRATVALACVVVLIFSASGCGDSEADGNGVTSVYGEPTTGNTVPWVRAYPTGSHKVRFVAPTGPCNLPIVGAIVERNDEALEVTLFGQARQQEVVCSASIVFTCAELRLRPLDGSEHYVDGAPRGEAPPPEPPEGTLERILRRCKPLRHA